MQGRWTFLGSAIVAASAAIALGAPQSAANAQERETREAGVSREVGQARGAGATSADQERGGRLASPTLTNDLGMEFQMVPAGSFLMGSASSDPDLRQDELPQHEVMLTQPFWMGTTEVTVGQFRAFVEDTDYVTEAEQDPLGGWLVDSRTGEARQEAGIDWRSPGFPQTDDHPVIQVSWVDAEAFCAWLMESKGGFYRLPTEAEWEYACRAGTTTRFWFGDDASDLGSYANVADASLAAVFPAATWSADWDDGAPFTQPVAQTPPNPHGLFDMHGNVWEWCSDWHSDTYYAESPTEDPRNRRAGVMRAIRGGGWLDPPVRNRSATRAWFEPVFRYCQLSGFRIVRLLVPSPN